MPSFAALLDRLIRASGFKKASIAERAGISAGTLSRYLAERGDISSEPLIKILNLLEIDLQHTLELKLTIHSKGSLTRDQIQKATLEELIAQLNPQEKRIFENSIRASLLARTD